jgi:sigma-B regulation protein RsbU (phosphoserine phosphatase)
MEAYVSYFRPLGWYIASTMPSDEVAAPATALVRRQVLIFAAVLSASLMLAWFFATKITGPLQRLTAYARELPTHDFNIARTDQQALDRLGTARSEVGGLARAFVFMERALRENIRALVQTTRAKERIESELNIAQDIQRGLLPKIFPPFPDCPQIDLHAALYPARHVGGDLFDFYFLDEHRLLFTVGDVADKGVPSALFMAITKTLVKSASSQDRDPARMMERVNTDLSADNPSAMFVTLLIGILDIRTGSIDYVNAGQNPPLLIHAASGEAQFKRDISGPPGGAMEGVAYRTLSMQLQPGDMLVVYTDGITEAMSPDKTEYGNDRLQQKLHTLSGASAKVIVGSVIDDVRHHSADEEQSDDITILCLSWRGDALQDNVKPSP